MLSSFPRILVVSDRPVRHRIAEFLREEGYDALSAHATSARESEIRNSRADLILLDHLCDGFDSFALYRILRRMDPDRPVLIVTLQMPSDFGDLREVVEWVFREESTPGRRRSLRPPGGEDRIDQSGRVFRTNARRKKWID